MFREEFELGGPVMIAIFVVWVVTGALVLERILYWCGRVLRRSDSASPDRLAVEAQANLARIDRLSNLATSLGLFGTVIGIARSFFARGEHLSLAAPEVLAGGLATALFTTVAGLAVFLFGQTARIVFLWLAERSSRLAREESESPARVSR